MKSHGSSSPSFLSVIPISKTIAGYEQKLITEEGFLNSPCHSLELCMVYTIARPTPEEGLQKFTVEEMRALVQPLIDEGFVIQIKG